MAERAPEAKLARTDAGLVPGGEGWFVVNAREAAWERIEDFGRWCRFENQDAAKFSQFGVNIHVLEPGKPNCMYHGEEDQEDFLVLSGECILVIEGQERRLRAWDFVHCPPWTEHVLVGAGERPCAVLMVGGRRGTAVRYPANDVAARHRAAVAVETESGEEAYAGTGDTAAVPYREGDLPG